MQDILPVIFKHLPFVSQVKISEISRSWRQAFFDPNFKIDPQSVLSVLFDDGIEPKNVRHAIEGALSQKIGINTLVNDPEKSLYSSILFVLMFHIDIANSDIRLSKIIDTIENEITKKDTEISAFRNINIRVNMSLKPMRYAAGDKKYKQGNQGVLQAYSSPNNRFINFNGGDISREDLTGAEYSGSNFVETNVSSTIFDEANLSEANLRGALVGCASFRGANLTGANFQYVVGALIFDRYTILDQTNLSEARLRGSLVGSVIFKGVNLMGSDLRDVRGAPIFDRNTILIGAEIGYCLQKAAKEAEAIFTLSDLAQRIKENPADFPNSNLLFIQAVRILLENKIKGFEAIPADGRDGLAVVKLGILRNLLPKIKEAEKKQDIKALRKAISDMMVNKSMKHIDTDEKITPYDVFSKPRAFLSSVCKEIGFFSDSIHTDSQNIIDEIRVALNILDAPKPGAPKAKVVVEAKHDQDYTDYSSIYTLPRF